MDYPDLKALGNDLYRCVKCGSCRSVCPVFTEIERETAVARGKLALIEEVAEGNLMMSSRFEDIISLCLGCSACEENCSNEVRVVEIIMAARAALVNSKRLSLRKRMILRWIMNTTHFLSLILKAGSLFQGLLFKRIPEESGLHLRFPLPYLDRRRFVPPLAKKFFLERYGGREIKTEKEIEKIGYFVGCITNYLFPAIGEAIVNLLKEKCVSIVLPEGQGCCGLPAFGVGDLKTLKDLAVKNCEAIERSGVDKILVACSSCAFALNKLYPRIFTGDQRFKKISSQIVEVSQYLSTHDWKNRDERFNQKIKVTYHDPCHLNRELGIKREPRGILKSFSQVELIEMTDPSRCCGSGGGFNLAHYDLSLKILDKKMEDIKATGAKVVVTSCTGCMLQLKDGAHQKGMKVEVLHLVEALDKLK